MKKMKMLCAVLVLLFAVPAFAQKKVAVVTFYADKQVDLSDVGLGSAAIITDLANDPTFNLQPILQQYHDKFFADFASKFPFELLPEKTVTDNATYQAFKPEFQPGYEATRFATIDGYKAATPNYGKSNVKNLLAAFSDADGIMFVYVTFALNKGFGVGGTATTKMQAYTNIVLYNKKGEKVFTINEHANASKTGMMVGGVPVMKSDKILPMCESALTELMKDLDKRFQKIVDKSAKKL